MVAGDRKYRYSPLLHKQHSVQSCFKDTCSIFVLLCQPKLIPLILQAEQMLQLCIIPVLLET